MHPNTNFESIDELANVTGGARFGYMVPAGFLYGPPAYGCGPRGCGPVGPRSWMGGYAGPRSWMGGYAASRGYGYSPYFARTPMRWW